MHRDDHLAIPLRIDISEISTRFITIPVICSINNDCHIPQNVSEIRIDKMVPLICIHNPRNSEKTDTIQFKLKTMLKNNRIARQFPIA